MAIATNPASASAHLAAPSTRERNLETRQSPSERWKKNTSYILWNPVWWMGIHIIISYNLHMTTYRISPPCMTEQTGCFQLLKSISMYHDQSTEFLKIVSCQNLAIKNLKKIHNTSLPFLSTKTFLFSLPKTLSFRRFRVAFSSPTSSRRSRHHGKQKWTLPSGWKNVVTSTKCHTGIKKNMMLTFKHHKSTQFSLVPDVDVMYLLHNWLITSTSTLQKMWSKAASIWGPSSQFKVASVL